MSEEPKADIDNFITPGHIRAFQISDRCDESGCHAPERTGRCHLHGGSHDLFRAAVVPLFVAVVESMDIVFAGEQARSGGGRSPKTRRNAFEANKV